MKIAFCAAIALGLLFSAQADAAIISVRVYENNVLQTLSGTSSTGALSIDGSTANFARVSVNAFGAPFTSAGDFIGQTTAISSASAFSGPVTLRLELTQQGLTAPFDAFSSRTTANLLINGSTISGINVSTYYDASNAAFGLGQLLVSNDYRAGSPAAAPAVTTNVARSSLYSQTIVMTATFSAGSAGLNTSSQVVPVATATPAVPEPATWAMMLAGFGGIGLAMRRRPNVGGAADARV